jgi:hypothetical protein
MKKLLLFLILTLGIYPEENIPISYKNKKVIYMKVKRATNLQRKAISFIEQDGNSETLSSLDGLSMIRLKAGKGDELLKVKEYSIDKKLIFTNKINKTENGFELYSFLGKNKKGKSIIQKVKYNQNAQILSIEYLDDSQKPIQGKNGFYKKEFTYHKSGKITSEKYFDLFEKLKEDKFGIAEIQNSYDTFGNLLSTKYFNSKQKLTENKNKVAEESYTYDFINNNEAKLVLKENFDREGNPKKDKNGIAKYVYKHNAQGNKILVEYRDEKSSLVEWNQFAKIKYDYDEKGRLILEEEYGSDGELKLDPSDSVAKITKEYKDSSSEEITITKFFDNKEKPCLNTTLGVHKIIQTKQKTKNGNFILEEYFDVDDKRKKSLEGYAILTKQFDLLENLIYEEYKDESEKLVISKDGYAKYTAKFQGKLLLQEEYLDLENKIIEGDEGYARQVLTYDKNNKLVKVENLDKDEKLVNSEFGYAKQYNTFNTNGYKIAEEYYDKEGKLVLNQNKFAKAVYYYDANCLKQKKEEDCISKIDYFSEKLKPIANNQGIARIENIYDKNFTLIATSYYNEKLELKNRKEYRMINEKIKEVGIETYKNNKLHRAVYYNFIQNPFKKDELIKISFNKFLRPIKMQKEED